MSKLDEMVIELDKMSEEEIPLFAFYDFQEDPDGYVRSMLAEIQRKDRLSVRLGPSVEAKREFFPGHELIIRLDQIIYEVLIGKLGSVRMRATINRDTKSVVKIIKLVQAYADVFEVN